MPSFLPGFGVFALAGLIAAAGPVIIHLLNRRRFRVVEWAAMDFLREALQRNRRMLRLRDLLLLAIRTACVLLFGLALARPFFAATEADYDPDRPVHAVLLVDNSLSMQYDHLGGTLLDEARGRARDFIDALPEGSRVSVIPLCGTPAGYSLDAYRVRDDAIAALDQIEAVDRSASGLAAAELAQAACQQAPLLSKRVVLLGDQQRLNWPAEAAAAAWQELPELQVVDVGPENRDNTWVANLQVQDAIADVETPTVLTATLRHEGDEPRSGVEVTLTVDGIDVASRSVDLQPGQSLPVSFEHRFDAIAEPGRPAFVPVSVSIPADHLQPDDARHAVVPVVAALPVVLVDQYGPDEDPRRNQYGETHHLRRLLAPVTSRSDDARHLVQIRHVKIDALDRELLADARLVIVAGIADPSPAVALLREYVEQGGQLVVACGGKFDPATWNGAAWLDGAGILPLPLADQPLGNLPEENPEELTPLQIAFDSLRHDYFLLPDVPRGELADLFREPFFFKVVVPDAGAETLDAAVAGELARRRAALDFVAESDRRRRRWERLEAEGQLTDEEEAARAEDSAQRAEFEPTWLVWEHPRALDRARRASFAEIGDGSSAVVPAGGSDLADGSELAEGGTVEAAGATADGTNATAGDATNGEAAATRAARAAEQAERTRPQVLARLDNGVPLLVQRDVGHGRILLLGSGVFSSWNTLPKTNAVLVLDRVMRSMLESTLPPRNFGTDGPLIVPVRARDRRGDFVLTRPDGSRQPLAVEATGAQRYGLVIRDATQRGVYKVAAFDSRALSADTDATGTEDRLWEVPLAVSGPADESDLSAVGEMQLADRLADVNHRWVARGEEIGLAGAHVYGQNLWWWLILAVLILLLVEMCVLAWPAMHREQPA